MVVFTCNNCGESLKKKDVEKHCNTRCRGGPFLTCIDCLKDFREEYVKHTVCISEDARYSAKGLNGLGSQPKTKQQLWVETVHDVVGKALDGGTPGITAGMRNLLEYLAEQATLPDKKKTFSNFVKNSRRGEPAQNIDFIWNLLDKAREELQAKLKAEREAAEAAKKKAKEEKLAKEGKQNGNDEGSSSSDDSSDDEGTEGKTRSKATKKDESTKNSIDLSADATDLKLNEACENGIDESLKKKKKKEKKDHNRETSVTEDTSPANDVELSESRKKKREKSESDSVSNGSVVESRGENLKIKKKKKKSQSECEQPSTVESVQDNQENLNEADTKLSKKERKEKKKREKYEAQLKEIENTEVRETVEDGPVKSVSEPNGDIEDDQDKKKKKKKNKLKDLENGAVAEACAPEGKKRKDKKNKKRGREEGDDAEENDTESPLLKKVKEHGTNEDAHTTEDLSEVKKSSGEFQWEKTILEVLQSQDDKEISVKKLCKKVISEYLSSLSEDSYYDEAKVNSKFHKKLAKMHNVMVHKEKAKLKTSRD